MKQMILFYIILTSMSIMQAQTTDNGQIEPYRIWNTIHHNLVNGTELDELELELDNIQTLPANMKALVAYFATLFGGPENKELAKSLGFSTLKEANQTLSKRWIVNKDTLEKTKVWYPKSLAFIHWDNKVFFWSGVFFWPSAAQLFEENSDGKMVFKQQFFRVRVNQEETPDEMLNRLYKEANFKPHK